MRDDSFMSDSQVVITIRDGEVYQISGMLFKGKTLQRIIDKHGTRFKHR